MFVVRHSRLRSPYFFRNLTFMMDRSNEVPPINAAFARLAIDNGREIVVESRCNRCGHRMVASFFAIGPAETEHLLACIRKERAAFHASSSAA
jgi:hypothetical protein